MSNRRRAVERARVPTGAGVAQVSSRKVTGGRRGAGLTPDRSRATVLRAAVPSMKLTESPRQPLDGETVRPVTVTVSARGVCCSWCIRSSTILGSDLVFREESSRGGPRSEYVALHVHPLLDRSTSGRHQINRRTRSNLRIDAPAGPNMHWRGPLARGRGGC